MQMQLGLLAVFLIVSRGALVINTWPWAQATTAGWQALHRGSALDAVYHGCTQCEIDQCDGTVGFGGSPDENGETTLDSLILDARTMNAGAVGGLRRVRNAIGVARAIMEHTTHTILVGDQATAFAIEMGFKEQSLATTTSIEIWENWKKGNCQPNYWNNVEPNHTSVCGPYKPNRTLKATQSENPWVSKESHDTIAMIAISDNGDIAVGTSSNGASHKIPGRVGDGPIIGAAAFADNDVGACGMTGDGDVTMRFSPCYQAVESMRHGLDPTTAAVDALKRIARFFPFYKGAIITANKHGQVGAAAHGWTFQYSYQDSTMSKPRIVTVPPYK